ncbi:conserved hypothetical protein [Culex quinquefasciatus]|uniref:Uncharacterized protein n=1 Tax=Culex quinquefasciatus TaxID=7176 RepID=B0XLU9_CULQU|nr:conserved hypothetical protein [Culex quinquefasciatus]|eukprot:XP_001870620.1 conserved hypothetical protein [Culex quinquefasciatus]
MSRIQKRAMNKPIKKRSKNSKPVVDEIEVAGKNLRDEALKYMKVRNFYKALGLYDQYVVSEEKLECEILHVGSKQQFWLHAFGVSFPFAQPFGGKNKTANHANTNVKKDLFNEPVDMKKRRYFDEVYTDKDRAAAVSIGEWMINIPNYTQFKRNYDIKQNLLNKRRQERHEALQLPGTDTEADPGAILTLGMREIKNGNLDNAALEMNTNDQSALVARSKCYLQLGEPAKALQV